MFPQSTAKRCDGGDPVPRGKGTQGWKSRVGHGQKGFTGMVPEVWKWLRLGLAPLIISFCWDGNYKAFSKKIEGRPDSNTFMLANFETSPGSTYIINCQAARTGSKFTFESTSSDLFIRGI